MKRDNLFLIVLIFHILILASCADINSTQDNTQVEGPFTQDNLKDLTHNTNIIIDDNILQTCYLYADSLGYVINKKDEYIRVLLGKSNIAYVYTDEANSDMVDEDDFLITFQEVRIVIDADTGVALGTIPFV
jgi:hypothetical protein